MSVFQLTIAGGEPLPLLIPDRIIQDTNLFSVYKCLFDLEKLYCKEDVMRIRVLGYFSLYSPTTDGQHFIASTVASCHNDSEILKMGEVFIKYLIRAFRKHAGRTPQPSFKSLDALDPDKSRVLHALKEPPRSHADAKKWALLRERYRCPVTNYPDQLAKKFPAFDLVSSYHVSTECSHIVPEAICMDGEKKSASSRLKADYSSSFWAILKGFGYNTSEELNGKSIHRLENVITLEKNIHEAFDTLNLWFEATDQKDIYEICVVDPLPPSYNRYADFTTSGWDKLPPPSPDYLALHATVCKVAHMAGVAEYLESTIRDCEDIEVLAADGTSGPLLHFALESPHRIISAY